MLLIVSVGTIAVCLIGLAICYLRYSPHSMINMRTIKYIFMIIILDDFEQRHYGRIILISVIIFIVAECVFIPIKARYLGCDALNIPSIFLVAPYFIVLIFSCYIASTSRDIISDLADGRLKHCSLTKQEEYIQTGKDLLPIISVELSLIPVIIGGVVRWCVEVMSYGLIHDIKTIMLICGVDLDILSFWYVTCIFVVIMVVVIPNYQYYSLMTVRLKNK